MQYIGTALIVLLGASLMTASSSVYAQADWVLHNARIYTVNFDQPEAEALAIRGDRILMVGSNEDVLSAYPNARREDAQGRTVIPGLIDAHTHLMGLGESLIQVDLVGTTSKQEILDRLEDFAQDLPEDAWLTGRGWDQNDWAEQEFPTRDDLDQAFPNRPVWLTRIDGHAAWANTAALEAVGLEQLRAMDDPEGGTIVRGEDGAPTGVFVDAAMRIVGQAVPEPSDAERDRALELALQETAKYGLTGVHDAGASRATVQRYQRFIDEGRFGVRLYAMIGGRGATFDHYCEAGPLHNYADRLAVRSVKFYIDGALGSRGAALLDEYSDDAGNRGLLLQQPDRFRENVRTAMECGFQVNTHAIGDRGNRIVLDAYETVMDSVGTTLGRHRVEHAQILAPDDIARFAELDVIASVQPTHATSDMYWAEDRLGPERIEGAYAWRSLLDRGARLALGSDFPVEQVNPLLGFYAAITRQDAEQWPDEGWHPEERMTRQEALRGFTLDAAYSAFQEDQLGSLEPGKLADFVVLSHNIMEVRPPTILETRVVATYLGGERIYHHAH
jgi:hypothetical protein